jgi:hypothetical protein
MTRTYKLSYQSPEGYTFIRPESFTITSIDELDALMDDVEQMNATEGKRLGVTFQLKRSA